MTVVEPPKLPDWRELNIPSTEEVYDMFMRLLGMERREDVTLPYFDAPNALRDAIRNKVKQDLHSDLWGLVEWDMLAARWEEVPELVENLLFGYLVKVSFGGDIPLFSGDQPLEEKVWSTYFRAVHDPIAMVQYMIGLIRSEGDNIDPGDIEVIEVLPNIPFAVWYAYKNGSISMDEVKEFIDSLPEV